MRIPVLTTLWKASQHWSNDRASYLGAAIAYNALFSIAPLLIIAIAMVGLIYGEAEVKTKILSLAQEHIGEQAKNALGDMVEQFWRPSTSLWAAIVGPIILLITACNFFFQLGTALGMIWNLPQPPARHWFISYLISYGFALAMVLMCGCFVFVIIFSDAFLTFLIKRVQDQLPGGVGLWHWLHLALYVFLVMLMLVLTFRFLSNRRIPYRKLWGGALVASLLFLLGRVLFGWYVSYMGASLATAFGAASSIVIFLIWVYYSAQILFFGAEVVKVHLQEM